MKRLTEEFPEPRFELDLDLPTLQPDENGFVFAADLESALAGSDLTAAAIGLAQVERAEELVARKREVFSWYHEGLSDCPVVLNHEPDGTLNTYWMVTALMPAELGPDKAIVTETLSKEGIDSRPFFHPLSSLLAYDFPGGSVWKNKK